MTLENMRSMNRVADNQLPDNGRGVYREFLQAASRSRGGTANSEVWG